MECARFYWNFSPLYSTIEPINDVLEYRGDMARNKDIMLSELACVSSSETFVY